MKVCTCQFRVWFQNHSLSQ